LHYKMWQGFQSREGHVANKLLLNVDQSAEFLNIRPSTVRAWILNRKIRFVKIGRRVQIRRSDLEAMISAGTVPRGSDNRVSN
jgi:excisionase family DNA binding protein